MQIYLLLECDLIRNRSKVFQNALKKFQSYEREVCAIYIFAQRWSIFCQTHFKKRYTYFLTKQRFHRLCGTYMLKKAWSYEHSGLRSIIQIGNIRIFDVVEHHISQFFIRMWLYLFYAPRIYYLLTCFPVHRLQYPTFSFWMVINFEYLLYYYWYFLIQNKNSSTFFWA